MSQLKVLSPFGPKIARLKFPELVIKKINFEVEEGNFLSPKFDNKGLIPVVTTDYKSGDILMHGYMNKIAF